VDCAVAVCCLEGKSSWRVCWLCGTAASTPSSRFFLRPLGSNVVLYQASTVVIFKSSPFRRVVLLCMAMTRVVGHTQRSEPVYAFMTPPSSTAHCLHDGRPSSSFWGPLEDVCAPSALYMQECLCPQMLLREPVSSAARQMLCDESTTTIFCAFFQGFGVQLCRSGWQLLDRRSIS